MRAGHPSGLGLVPPLTWSWGFNRSHDRLATSLNVDVADRNLFRLLAAQIVQRFDELDGD
jgi:hypothetical protein